MSEPETNVTLQCVTTQNQYIHSNVVPPILDRACARLSLMAQMALFTQILHQNLYPRAYRVLVVRVITVGFSFV